MINEYIIYGLYCPFTDNLHYIGKSSCGMTRPMQHLNESHSEKISEWVTQLKFIAYKPIVRILEKCNKDNIDEREKFHIQKALDEEEYLLNIAHNYTHTILKQSEYKCDDADTFLIGKKIREARIIAKLSQCDLSKMAGIDRTTLVRIEKGNKQISVKNLKEVLNVLGFELAINSKT